MADRDDVDTGDSIHVDRRKIGAMNLGDNQMKVRLLGTAIIAVSSIPAGLPHPAQAQNRSGTLEEVVVSAQRRDQSLQDVPISISAFNEGAIEKFRIENLTDLGLLVPNLSAVEGSGGTRGVVYQIRGLYASGTALGADSGVATYIDGVYLRGGSSAIVNYADIERIEVLRGPQGTLFGRNTSGGAINFITRNPPGEFGFLQKLTAGNYDRFDSKTRIDTPKWGPVSASLTYSYGTKEGPVDNDGAGFTADLTPFGGNVETSPKRLGDEDSKAVFLAVNFDLHDDLKLIYKYDYNEMDATPPAVGILGVDTSPGNIPSFLVPLISSSFGDELPDSVNNAFHMKTYQEAWGHNLTAEYALTDSITLRNILSYREGFVEVPGQTLDGVGQFAPGVILFQVTGGQKKEELSDEIQMIWSNDAFTWTTGYLYYGVDMAAGGYEHVRNGILGGQGALSVYPGPATARNDQSDVEIDSNAIYSQFEYHLTQQWDVVLGGRFTNDKKDYVDRTLPNQILEVDYDNDEFTYLLGLNYKPTDDILIFSKYSTGYISGGLVSGLEYDSEKSTSFEVGSKATWLDGTLQTNLALYYVEYTDQQFGTAGSLVVPPIPAPQVLVNAGDTEAKGFELEATWLPLASTQLGLNLGYLDFEFKDVDFALLGGPISPHLRPKWTSTITADHETDPLFGEARLQFHVDASYRSEEWIATRPVDFIERDKQRLDPIWRFNAQVSLQGIRIADGELSIAAWGRNLTDSDKPNNMNTLGPIVSGQYENPRTYGVDLTYEY